MDRYNRGPFDYMYDLPPPGRKVPRSYDPYPQPVEYPRQAQRVYAAVPAAVSYPTPRPNNTQVEYRYYNPEEGLPFPIRPAPAPVVAAGPSVQIQYPQLPSASGQQFVPGQLYKVVGVEETHVYQPAPPVPRAEYGYGPPPVSRGVPPQRRLAYGPYY